MSLFTFEIQVPTRYRLVFRDQIIFSSALSSAKIYKARMLDIFLLVSNLKIIGSIIAHVVLCTSGYLSKKEYR